MRNRRGIWQEEVSGLDWDCLMSVSGGVTERSDELKSVGIRVA